MTYGTGLTRWQSQASPAWAGANFAQVNIGRNIGDTPMDEFDWATFAILIRHAITEISGTRTKVIEVEGKGGEWLGVPEETRIFMILDPLVNENSAERFLAKVEDAGKEFQQDAVAVVFGTSALI